MYYSYSCFIFFLFHHVQYMFYCFLIAIFKNPSVKSVYKKSSFAEHMVVSVIVFCFIDVSSHNTLNSHHLTLSFVLNVGFLCKKKKKRLPLTISPKQCCMKFAFDHHNYKIHDIIFPPQNSCLLFNCTMRRFINLNSCFVINVSLIYLS